MELEKFKEKLDKEKEVLERELKSMGVVNKETNDWEATPPEEVSGPEADENDLADRFEDFEERSSTLNELEVRLAAVNKALEKIDNEKYGICEIGGEEIEIERLEANPAAMTCVKHLESNL